MTSMPSVSAAWGFSPTERTRRPNRVRKSTKAVTLNASLASPWGLAFLPDGRMLVTQKAGSMLLLSADGATVLATLSGVPAVDSAGQGGLLEPRRQPQHQFAEVEAGHQRVALQAGGRAAPMSASCVVGLLKLLY